MKGVRVFVLVFAGCVLVAALVGPYLVRTVGEEVVRAGSSIAEDAVRATKEGRAFGEIHPQNECVDAALDRVKDCDSVFCKSTGVVFVKECLGKAAESPLLCREVPSAWLARWLWPRRHCSELGADPQSCQAIFKVVADFCGSARAPAGSSQSLPRASR